MYSYETRKRNQCFQKFIQKRKINQENRSNILSDITKEYLSSSNIHGVNYLGAEDKRFIEKIWWIIALALSITCCALLIVSTWQKWKNNPVIVTFDQEQIPVWDIPFPAVTICSFHKISQLKYNYTQHFRSRDQLTEKEHNIFWDISTICNIDRFKLKTNGTNKYSDRSIIDNIIKASRQDSMFEELKWQNEIYNQSGNAEKQKFMAHAITKEGLCFTFNSLAQEDLYTAQQDPSITLIYEKTSNEGWNLEQGYQVDTPIETYPRRVLQDGAKSGLYIRIHEIGNDTDFVCGHYAEGYKIILHTPAEVPKVKQQFIVAPKSMLTTVTVTPDVIKTSTGLLNIAPNIRKCYFSHEKHLRFFKIYTETNCKMECVSNVTKQYCGCVHFAMPRDNNTAICGYASLECINNIEGLIIKYEMMQRDDAVHETVKREKMYQIFLKCECLPSCLSLGYKAQSSQIYTTHWFSFFDSQLKRSVKFTTTEVEVFFKETQFMALYRSELYGQTDFLAKCGGLLGLFMGVSLLSLFEILFFLTLRMYYKIKYRKEI